MSNPAVLPDHQPAQPAWTAYLPVLVPLALLLVTFAAYAPALRGEFIWDDDYYVVNNRALRSFEGIQSIWLGIFPTPRAYPAPQYYPMTFTSLWLDYRIWGANPLGYHITNVTLHALCAWLVWIILRKLAVPGALLAAFVFALHPVHIESVAWITERKNVLSGAFYLLSLLVYLRFCGLDRPPAAVALPRSDGDGPQEYKMELPSEPWKVYALSLFLFALALLSKSVTATLPAAVLLILWWKRGRIEKKDVMPLIPFFALGLLMSMLTSWIERNVVGAVGEEWAYNGAQRLLIAGRAAWFYVGKVLWPMNLMFMYPKWDVDPTRLVQWLFPLGVVAVIVLALLARKKLGDGVLAGILFFLGTSLPALGFFNFLPMRYSFVADHYIYLASLGLIVPIAAGCAWIFRTQPGAGVAVGAILCAGLGVQAMRQSRIYKSPEALWTHTIQNNPASWMAHNNLGIIQLERGDLSAAEKSFQAAADLRKENPEAYTNLGRVAELQGRIDAAVESYTHAVRINAARFQREGKLSRRSFAVPYTYLGTLRLNQGDVPRALTNLRAALSHDRENPRIMANLGEAMRQSIPSLTDEQAKRDTAADALELLSEAVDLDPTFAPARLNLAILLIDVGRPLEAADQLIILRQQGKFDARGYVAAGNAVASVGQYDAAIEYFQEALKLDPDLKAAQQNLEVVRARAATQPAATRPAGPTTQPGAFPN